MTDSPAGATDGTSPPVDPPVPAATAASWDQAEARLYPAITTRPDLYQRVVTAVRLTLDALRLLGPSTRDLLATAPRAAELVDEVLATHGLPTYELDLDLVGQAALAMRHREVTAGQASTGRLEAIARAREEGRLWVVVHQSGFSAGDPFVPYTRVEVEVATGFGLLVTARPDADFRQVEHAVEPVQLDLSTGAVEPVQDLRVASTTHPSATAREEHAAAVRELVSRS